METMTRSMDEHGELESRVADGGGRQARAKAVEGLIVSMLHIVPFVLGMVCGVILTTILLGRSAAGAASAPAPVVAVQPTAVAQQGAAPAAEVQADVTVSETLAGARDYTRLGKADAPVQLVLFADPQCPFCKQLALDGERQAIADYVNTGKAAITYRHYAFLGSESTRAAAAMECAGKQGAQAFWAFEAHVFQNQLPENSGQLTDARLLDWAKSAGIDLAKLGACLTAGDGATAVQADLQAGTAVGVRGTPVLFVNGHRLVGAVPYDYIKSAIEAELAKSK
jgi:protein-disulfide isomerase